MSLGLENSVFQHLGNKYFHLNIFFYLNSILPFYRHEALTSALSEKDAHLALLEMSGVKDATTSDTVDRLRAERADTLEKIKRQVSNRYLLQFSELALDLGVCSVVVRFISCGH